MNIHSLWFTWEFTHARFLLSWLILKIHDGNSPYRVILNYRWRSNPYIPNIDDLICDTHTLRIQFVKLLPPKSAKTFHESLQILSPRKSGKTFRKKVFADFRTDFQSESLQILSPRKYGNNFTYFGLILNDCSESEDFQYVAHELARIIQSVRKLRTSHHEPWFRTNKIETQNKHWNLLKIMDKLMTKIFETWKKSRWTAYDW